jgi:short-subunit dehydrogenase
MKVFVTGAFGNIGQHTIRELLRQGYQVASFDLRTSANMKAARKLAGEASSAVRGHDPESKRFGSYTSGRLEAFWGDIRNRQDLARAFTGAAPDVVIQLAYIIPPGVDREPVSSREVNVGGTANLISVLVEQPKLPRLIFASSVMVFGNTRDRDVLCRACDPMQPVELYGQHKAECERMITASGLPWTILRLGAAPAISIGAIDPVMFEIPLDTRIEFVHPADAGLAFANAVSCPATVGRVLLIGGGKDCRMYQRDFMTRALDGLGIGMLPESAFGHTRFNIDWMDTAESEQLLHYQRHGYGDYVAGMRRLLGARRFFIRALGPIIRAAVLQKSPYYRAHPNFAGKVAVVTGASSGIGAVTALRLAREGLKVVLVARREDRLHQLADEIRQAGGEALVVAADVSDENDRIRVYETIRAHHGTADILVNNAGLAWYGYGCRMPWNLAAQMIKVNAEALAHFTMLYLPEMRARSSGHIINIGSISGSLPEQGTMVYSATKAFADAFTTVLYRELRGTGVHTSVVRAGPVTTELYSIARGRSSGMQIPAERFAIPAEVVADRVWSLLIRPRRVAYVPRILWFSRWVEPYFDWIIDRLGPLLLKRASKTS